MRYGLLSAGLTCLVLAGCVVAPAAQVRPESAAASLIAYPVRGQSPEQLDRDRYECHLWAVQTSGVDPSLSGVPAPVYRAAPVDTGASVAASAVVGSLIGAVVAPPWHTGEGLAVGALAGAAVGAIAAGSANAAAQAPNPPPPPVPGTFSYRRAMDACLSGRGYAVR
jgi:hypothetical protein